MSKRGSAVFKSATGRWAFSNKDAPGAEPVDNPNEILSSSTRRKVVRHPNFFFDNVLVAIEIEDTLFNVHKYQLIKSEVFSDMFSLPKPEGDAPEEGSSPDNPIVIEGVAASDFAALLTVLYASYFTSNPPTPEASLVIPAFRLANLFNFSELRAYLLPLAEEKLDDVDKIVFAREFDINEWLVPAHVRLCQREKSLNGEEARKLGIESVLIIWRMREQYGSRSSSSHFPADSIYCDSCMTDTGGLDQCSGCGKHGCAYLRYNGPAARSADTTSTGDSAIEAGVKKWVEEGCTVND